jgi:prevent-host-death family protein
LGGDFDFPSKLRPVHTSRYIEQSLVCLDANHLAIRTRNDYYDYDDHTERGCDVDTPAWTVAEAKAKFSEVIDKAKSDGPQTITRNGRRTVVVVAAEEWERKTKRKGNLAEFFAASPLRGSGLKVRHLTGRPRKVDL